MKDQMRKALDFAIAKEKEAEAFYKEWSQKAKDPAVQGLFAQLAGIEHGHMEMLSQIAGTLDGQVARTLQRILTRQGIDFRLCMHWPFREGPYSSS